jgi:pimeloyl-ACP methyl ester carboxylesterase
MYYSRARDPLGRREEMIGAKRGIGRPVALAVVAALAYAGLAPSAAGAADRVQWIKGFDAPGTPKRLDRVGVLKIGPARARNVLVFNPGTSAGSAYIAPFARTLVKRAKGWQVWSVERRENQLEDQSVAEKAKEGEATLPQLFDYYLGWINNPAITKHFKLIPDSQVEFAKRWGMRVEIQDLRRVVKAAEARGGRVVVMGHSLGGTITTAYATWDFGGTPGAKGLAGLVYDDGGSGPEPAVTAADARQALANLDQPTSSPWLAFGGIAAPFAGLFAEGGSILSIIDPDGPSIGQSSGLLPSSIVPPVPVTNLAQFGYAADPATSPPNLLAFQAHVGHLAAAGTPGGWVRGGAITPIGRYAKMFSGWGLKDVDGVAWYHPLRLTIDAGAVADGNRNAAQRVFGVRTTDGSKLPRSLRIYAFGAFGGRRVLDDAQALARQSRIPRRNLTLVDRHGAYAHNDPAGAFPKNAFLNHLVPFLDRIAGES